MPEAELRRMAAEALDGADKAPSGSAPVRAQLCDTDSGIDFGDWDDLFNAVKQRLTRIVSAHDGSAGAAAALTTGQMCSAVLECVAALEQLHATVTTELVRRDGLEMAVFEAQTSLAQVRAALLGTQEEERKARFQAAHDALTELPNRGYFVQRITHELSRPDVRQRIFAVMFLDLDGLTGVNDRHGRAAGDELLRIVAARLRRLVRAQDMVSRAGGDEFALLIGGLQDRVQLAQLAGKIAESIAVPCTLGGLQLAMQASIGIAIAPTDGAGADILLRNAAAAMIAARRQQLGCAFFSPDGADAPSAAQDPAPRLPQPPRS